MKPLTTLVVVLLIVASGHSLAGEKVVSALPILHSLNLELLRETDVEPVYLPPKRLPVSRISNWLQQRSSQTLSELGPVTAFTTVESVRPEFTLFPHLRAHNIGVIPVDAAHEILSGGARISLSEQDLTSQSYFWLLPDNLVVMSQILARDYIRIWPDLAGNIAENQSRLQNQIMDFALQFDQLLLEKGVESVCLHHPDLEPLAQATYLPIDTGSQCDDRALHLVQKKRSSVAAQGTWLVDSADRPLNTSVRQWLMSNLSALEQGLN